MMHSLQHGTMAVLLPPGLVLWLLLWLSPAGAQEIEPRRWTHLPINMNFAGLGYAFTRADIYFDPVLETEDVVLDHHAVAARYVRSFALVDRSARVELELMHEDARWEGLLRGEQAAATRGGFADPLLRFALNLLGGPPLEGAEFARYRASHPVETILGVAMAAKLPLGQYYEDKLLNLGENRFTFRPALGMVHNHRKWSAEVTGSLWLFTDNHAFWNGNKREQDPLFIIQGHGIYTFRPGVWVSGSAAYGTGGASTINGVDKNDTRKNLAWAVSVGYPLTRALGLKIATIGNDSRAPTGFDSNSVAAALSVLW